MKKRLLLGVLISALVIIGFTSCNQPSSQTVLYPPVIKDFKLVDGSVNPDTVYDALPAKKIKYEKNYTVVVSFSDLDLNTTELHLSLDNFNRDDVTFNINTKYTDQISWWNESYCITGTRGGNATIYYYVKDIYGLTSPIYTYNINLY
ncbi:MAG: hypothetical protein SOZ96_02980 [Treponema sp.]|nr:hypothetical protein [Treponema sp.]